MQDSREQKQSYLSDNIINNNYDPDEFIDYCQEQKGSVDIDSWSFQEVIKLVDRFVNKKRAEEAAQQHHDPFDSVFSKPTVSIENRGDFMQFEQKNNVLLKEEDFAFDYSTPTVAPIAFDSVDFDFLSGNFKHVEPQKPKTKVQSMQRDVDAFNNMGSGNQATKKGIFNNMNVKKNNQDQVHNKQQEVQPKTQIKPAYQPKAVPNIGNNKIESPPKKQQTQPKTSSSSLPPPASRPVPVPVPVPVPITNSATISNNSGVKQEVKALEMVKQSITCRKINPKQVLSNSNPYVHIENHEIVSPSMFLPNFVLYHIRVNPLGIEVRRKYKDFQLLRQILLKLYPLTRLPYLNSNNRLSETEQSAIKKQKYMLQSFLNDLLLNKEFLSSKVIEQFLTLKDESLFKKKFKQYQKLGEIKSIEDLASLSGTYDLFFTQKHYDFCEKVPAFLNVFEAYQQKIRTLYQTLSNSIQASTKILLDISETYSSFEQFIMNFNNSTSAIQNFISLEGTYNLLSELHKEWALSFSQQIKLIDNDIRPGLKFDKQNVLQTTKQIMKLRNNITQSYLKRAQRQPVTQKYNSSKLQSYKLSLSQPSKSITVLKYQNAFANSKMTYQVGRLFRDLSLKLERRYGIMAKLQTNIVQNLKNVWDGWAIKAM